MDLGAVLGCEGHPITLAAVGQVKERHQRAVSGGELQINCQEIIYHNHQSVSPGRADTWKYEIIYTKVGKQNECQKI